MSAHHRFHGLCAVALLASLAACDRSNPPSEQLERAAEELVTEVDGEQLPERPAGPWAPRNECNDLPGATDFLADLQAAIDTRDTEALAGLAADDVRLDFGGGGGTGQLRGELGSAQGVNWEMLEELLELGCAAGDETMLTLPWYFAQETPVDPYAGAIVTGEDVKLRNAPGSDAEVLQTLSWEVVERLPSEAAGDDFDHVRWTDPDTDEEIEGFIAKQNLRGIIDYRLIANRRNNRWRITALVAGD